MTAMAGLRKANELLIVLNIHVQMTHGTITNKPQTVQEYERSGRPARCTRTVTCMS